MQIQSTQKVLGMDYWRIKKVLNQIFSNKIIDRLGYTSMIYYLSDGLWKLEKTPYIEQYARWCGKPVDEMIIYILPDYRFYGRQWKNHLILL